MHSGRAVTLKPTGVFSTPQVVAVASTCRTSTYALRRCHQRDSRSLALQSLPSTSTTSTTTTNAEPAVQRAVQNLDLEVSYTQDCVVSTHVLAGGGGGKLRHARGDSSSEAHTHFPGCYVRDVRDTGSCAVSSVYVERAGPESKGTGTRACVAGNVLYAECPLNHTNAMAAQLPYLMLH